MRATNISINDNRVAVEVGDKTAQFIMWDLQPAQHDDCRKQLELAFAVGKTFEDVEKHMKINGYDCSLEDIY